MCPFHWIRIIHIFFSLMPCRSTWIWLCIFSCTIFKIFRTYTKMVGMNCIWFFFVQLKSKFKQKKFPPHSNKLTHWYWCRQNNVHYFDASAVFEPFLFYLLIKWQRLFWHFDRPTLQIQYFFLNDFVVQCKFISYYSSNIQMHFIPQFYIPNLAYIEYEIVCEYFESQFRNSILQIIDVHSIWFRIVSVHNKLKIKIERITNDRILAGSSSVASYMRIGCL